MLAETHDFTVPDLTSRPTLEPVVEVPTIAGPLLLPRDDRVITPVLRGRGVWEPPETAYLRAVLRPGQTFVDVGAHVGYFSVLAAKLVGPAGKVIAVEPEPRNFDLLCRNLARSGCTGALAVPFAAHSAQAWMSLELNEENRGAHYLVPASEGSTPARCVRLDDVLPDVVDVVKIDVQGYDHDAIAGLERTLAANPGTIVIAELSLHSLERRGLDPRSVFAHYEDLGFTISMFDKIGRPRPVTAEMAIEACRDRDRSLLLTRPSSGAAQLRDQPIRVEGLEVTEAPEGLIVYQRSYGLIHRLNHTAALVFDLCTGRNEVSEIVRVVGDFYDRAEAPEGEVTRCLRHLREKGLVI